MDDLNIPVPYKYKVLWAAAHHFNSNMPAHSMYFILTLFPVIYIPEVSTVFAGTLYRLNYGVYFQTIHPAVQLRNNYIIGSINISLPSLPIRFDVIKDPCKTFLEGSTASQHHIQACRRMERLTKELKNLRLNIVSKVKYTLMIIQRILANTPNISPAHLHHNKRTRRSSPGLLPFIGEISKVLFGTATESDVRNQLVGVN